MQFNLILTLLVCALLALASAHNHDHHDDHHDHHHHHNDDDSASGDVNAHNHDHDHVHSNPVHGEEGHVHGPGCNHGDFSKPLGPDRGNSALMSAVLKKDKAAFDAILNEGDMEVINAQNLDGVTALMFALGSRQLDTAKTLIESGCNVHLKNKDGVSALPLAIHLNNLELVKMMVKEGADLMALAATDKKASAFLARNPDLINADILRDDGSVITSGSKTGSLV